MKVVLDTNVFISGVFFSGPPYQILRAWRNGKIQLVVSQEMLEEYVRVGEILAERSPGVDLGSVLDLLAVEAKLISAPRLAETVCDDPDDDKFLACALASKITLIISGDKHLLRSSGYGGIKVVKPREFVEEYL